MSFIGKIRLGALLSAALVAGTLSAQAETVKFAHVDGEGDLLQNTYWTWTEVFSSSLGAQTAGKYDVEVYPNGQMGDLESLAEQNARGILQMVGGLNAGHISSYAPIASVLELPYSFPSTAIARKVLDGDFGKSLSDKIAEASGIRILSYLPSAFRNFSSSTKMIKTPADMVGMKMRTQQIPIHVEMVKALGASPTPIAWAELYSALQTGVVDGQENAPYTMLMANLQEVQKYYTLDHHLVNMPLITINEDYWKSLPAEDKKAFEAASAEATFAMLGVIAAKESQDLAKIRAAGIEIYQPNAAEFKQFVDAAQSPVAEILSKEIGSEIIEELKAAVAKAQAE
jgi:tripartite ATP-independent transporter DctP family solute receptor